MFTVSEALAWLGKNFGDLFSLQEERSWDDEKGSGMITTCTLLGQLLEVAFWRPKNWKHDWLLAGFSRLADRLELFRAKSYLTPGVYRHFKLVLVEQELVVAVLAGDGPKTLQLRYAFPLKDFLPLGPDSTARNSLAIAGKELLMPGGDIASGRRLKIKTNRILNVGYALTPVEQSLGRLEEKLEKDRRKELVRAAADKREAEERERIRRKEERAARRQELHDRTLRKWIAAYTETGERVSGCPLTVEEYRAGYHGVADHGDLFLVVSGWNQPEAKAEAALRHFRLVKKGGAVAETEVKENLTFTRPQPSQEKPLEIEREIVLIDSANRVVSAMVIASDETLAELRRRGTNHGALFVRTREPAEDGRYQVYAFRADGVDTVGLMTSVS